MRARVLISALCGAWAATTFAVAETVVTPDAFERMTEGRTLAFDRNGSHYGVERYLPGREVIWEYADKTCSFGHWFAAGTHICFVYDNAPTPQCWIFAERDGAFFARMSDLPPRDPSEIRLTGDYDGPFECPAPNLGV